MTPRSQRGQALPAVLAIMLVLVLLAGSASMAISAVLSQQRVNQASTNADLSTQNAVAATAAKIAGGSACGPVDPAAPDMLFQDSFLSNNPPLGQRWNFIAGNWQVQQSSGAPILVGTDPNSNAVTPNVGGAGQWSNYRVSVVMRPEPNNPGANTMELDAYFQGSGQTYSAYWLQLQGGDTWRFGRTPNNRFAISGPTFNYDPGRWQTLELDVFGSWVTARLNDQFLSRHQETQTPLGSGSIAIRADGPIQVASVSVDQPFPVPTPVSLAIPNPLPSPGLAQQFHCQRLGDINTGAVSQQPALDPNAGACAYVNASVTVPAGGGHVRIWFTVPWPGQIVPVSFTLSLGGCPTDQNSMDCGRQRSTIVRAADQQPWMPGLTMVAADCASTSANQGPRSYRVYLTPTSRQYSGRLPPMVVRAAPEQTTGGGSVYMTVMPVRAASGEPYEESDILTQGSGTVLSYEGVLG